MHVTNSTKQQLVLQHILVVIKYVYYDQYCNCKDLVYQMYFYNMCYIYIILNITVDLYVTS